MKPLITTLIMIFISFGASAKTICKIDHGDVRSYVIVEQKFNPYTDRSGKRITQQQAKTWTKKMNDQRDKVDQIMLNYDYANIIDKKCNYGDILVINDFHSYKEIKKLDSNPYFVFRSFNNLITRVCDRDKNIRQISSESYVYQDSRGIQNFLECIYSKDKDERKPLPRFFDPK